MIRVSSFVYRGAIFTAILALAFVAGCKKKPPPAPPTPEQPAPPPHETDRFADSQSDFH